MSMLLGESSGLGELFDGVVGAARRRYAVSSKDAGCRRSDSDPIADIRLQTQCIKSQADLEITSLSR